MQSEMENERVDTSVLPELESLEFQKHPARYKSYRFLISAIIWIFPIIGLIFVWIFAPMPWPWIPTGIIGLFIAISLIGIPIGYKYRMYVLRERDLTYKKGWIFFSTVTIPFNRIQHTEVSQGPIEKKYDICTLKIFTAGGSTSDLSIPGLEEDEAQQIREYVAKKAALYA